MLIAGLPPFTIVALDLHFALKIIWEEHLYYTPSVFLWILPTFLALFVACAETAIILTYFRLCKGVSHFICQRIDNEIMVILDIFNRIITGGGMPFAMQGDLPSMCFFFLYTITCRTTSMLIMFPPSFVEVMSFLDV
jgi:hypothetical protein